MLQLNSQRLLKVLRDFYILTKIRIVVFDADFKELLSYPTERLGFCGALRQDGQENAHCVNSDRLGCQRCAGSMTATFYRCHAGLTEAVVPIMDRSGIIGYVMFGQVIPKEDYLPTKTRIKKRYPQLEKEIEGISVKSAEELNAAATVLQALTAYVINNHWVIPEKSVFVRQMDGYIAQHIQESIVVEDLCVEFGLGRTRLYSLSMTCLGCAPAEYIRNQRIEYAKKMLTETDLPIMDIAFAVGFSDYNHFSRVFKKITGVSARVFQKENCHRFMEPQEETEETKTYQP